MKRGKKRAGIENDLVRGWTLGRSITIPRRQTITRRRVPETSDPQDKHYSDETMITVILL